MPISFDAFLRNQGLEPLSWEQVLHRVEQKLTSSEAGTFKRLHRAFTAYPTPHTARGFYDFVAAHDLLAPLAGFRFERLVALGAALLAARGTRASRVLDVGAGGGWLSEWLRQEHGARVAVSDLSPEVLRRLADRGFEVFDAARAAEERFDLILCADSLGEIHADEDDWLADPANAEDPGYADELEARYGFAAKLAPLRSRLAPGGEALVFEPVPLPHFWRGAARALEGQDAWSAEVIEPRGGTGAWGLRLTPP